MFRIVVTEILSQSDGEPEATVERFSITVDQVDIAKVFAAVTAKPRKPRVRKQKADAA